MQRPISEMKRPAAGFKIAARCLAALLTIAPAAAQQNQRPAPTPPPSQAAPATGPVAIPGFWDPKRRPERPDMSRITVIRFMTEVDYPPFNYAGPDGNPIGFNVDLAR